MCSSELILIFVQVLEMWALVLLSVAYFTLMERKVLGIIQSRLGPNNVGLSGLFQPFSDAIKLISKTNSIPNSSNGVLYVSCVCLIFWISLVIWLILPSFGLISWNCDVLVLTCYMTVSVLPSILLSWASNSNYSLLGSTRSVILSISYEIPLSFLIFGIIIFYSSVSFFDFFTQMDYSVLASQIGFAVLFIILMFVECGRSPFDLSEGESELVSGFNVEFGGGLYVLIFLSEYVSLFFVGFLFTIFFSGGCLVWPLVIIWLSAWIRATIPRMRFDVLINAGWLILTPLCLIFCLINVVIS